MSTTAKTVIELLAWTYRERWGFFPMERAKSAEISARLLKPHMRTDDLNHIGAIKQFLDERLGNHKASA